MLQIATRGAEQLSPHSRTQCIDFIHQLAHPDGGYRGRGASSDLYYTVFAMKILIALNAELPVKAIETYLQSVQSDKPLDLVHLSCLARCWANLPGKQPSEAAWQSILDQVAACRTGPTGFANQPGQAQSSIYSSFMALSAYQDLQEDLPDQDAVIEWLFSQEAADEGFAHQSAESMGLTPITAGAVILLKHLNVDIPAPTVDWLLSRHNSDGGFYAAPMLPFPDLLSTATALHALSTVRAPLESIRQPCLRFIHSLWRDGGFCGMAVDETLDCEYTFYGLLALGNLAE
jgi:hypothetical protein